ncbi:MAG: DUF4317 domain-containing protein [Ruminococcaceae bacterium]|nr:DUF4317 domain-containing protein [Oscillospiraceae bacterium]
MNIKEISEIRRHIRRDRSNMTAIYGCYVNDNKEIISEFRRSTGMMSENEGEKYFSLMKRALSGSVGRNLIDITFKTAQVMEGEEHKFLMKLRETGLNDPELREEFYKKVIDSVSLGQSYLILLGCDSYDVPFKSKDGLDGSEKSDETYKFLLCAICPVKQVGPTLHYVPEEKEFHDGGISNVVSAPELGFLFPAFDQRSTNIYNALYYTHSPKESHQAFVDAMFRTQIPKPAYEQKRSFEAILSKALEDECSLDVVQTMQEELVQRIALHKESRVPEALTVSKEDMQAVLSSCGVSESHLSKFSVDFDEAFGYEADVHPKNIIDEKRLEVKMPDVSIKVAADRGDLIETRVIGGIKYILINAEENVEVNGVSIHIEDGKKLSV